MSSDPLQCHPQCNLGVRNRTVVCRIQPRGDIVDLDVCDPFSPAPKRQDTCREQLVNVPCSNLEPKWSVGDWTPVSLAKVHVCVMCGVSVSVI